MRLLSHPVLLADLDGPCRINPNIQTVPITSALLPDNALDLLNPYDIILDCTDNAPTRYLLSDTAVALGKPLVSGAAQKFDGQLCTYNLGDDGPCYRCLFPKSPAPELTGSCEEVGILGAVTGVIGNLQALEAVKLLTGLHGMCAIPYPSTVCRRCCGAPQLQQTNVLILASRQEAIPADLLCPIYTTLPQHQATNS